MTRYVLLAVLLLCANVPAGAQDLPRIYLSSKAADASGFVDPGEKQRREVLKDLTGALRDKKKTLTLVDKQEDADVLLELTNAEIGNGSRQTSRVNPLSHSIESSKDKAYLATVVLKAGDYSTELSGEGLYSVIAARQIAKSVEQWVKDNRQTLLDRRAKQ